MDFQVGWTDSAIADVEEIVEIIARKSPDVARRIGQGLFAHVKVLRSFPYLGMPHACDAPGDIRQISYKKYRMIYQVHTDEESVEILTVWHGARREPPLFDVR